MQIKFPNNYGFEKPSQEAVNELQSEYKFSDEYADFLLTQNGFVSEEFDNSDDKSNFMIANEAECHQELVVFYGINDDDQYYNLVDSQIDNIFKKYFFIIGCDPAGNEFIEALHGKYKGYIASIDHELYASCENLKEFFEEFELGNPKKMSLDVEFVFE